MRESCSSKVLETVLAGRQEIVSHAGTGQYQATSDSTSVGTAACGLAALNCARVTFQYQEEAEDNCESCEGREERDVGHCLLDRVLSQPAVDEIISICSSWTTNAHLDVEDILDLPIFKRAFDKVKTCYGQASRPDFETLLQDMLSIEGGTHGAVASVITRPPEIVVCLTIPVQSQHVFVIFDSHPRPAHPSGSGFILNSSIEKTATYLDQLLSIDPAILADPSLRWQAQILGHFLGHILVPKQDTDSPFEMHDILMDASVKVLRLQAQLADFQHQMSSLTADNEYLSNRVTKLEESQRPVDRKGKGKVSDSRALQFSSPHDTPQRNSIQLRNNGGQSSSANSGTDDDLAQSLQARFDEESRQLATERDTLLETNSTFKCLICFDVLHQDYVARVGCCSHAFCRDCLRSHVTGALQERRYPISCPACVADNVKKPMCVDEAVLTTLGISNEAFEIYQEIQLALLSILVHCRGCKESMFIDKAEYQAASLIVCPLQGCNHVWCKKCEQSIRVSGPQHSCDGSTELADLMKRKGWRHCPGCQTPIQKDSGCNHMTCLSSGCNTHFCYVCGEKITQSLSRTMIRSQVSAHYRRCMLFQDVAGP